MQFKHPEILFALFLLIIPILVHLFQFQKFVKVLFTNVQLLQQLKLQTRKSSQLKKWLILFLRMLAFSALIFAFSQPYFSKNDENLEQHTTIILDNSLSMQVKKNGVELLKLAAQEIIENFESTENLTLITNDQIHENLDGKSLKNTLQNLYYSTNYFNLNSILLKNPQLKTSKTNTLYNNFLISDFQNVSKNKLFDVTNVNSSISLINIDFNSKKNIAIDSVYISEKNNTTTTLKVIISHTNAVDDIVPVSLFNDEILIGKASTTLAENSTSEVEFETPSNKPINGILKIDDSHLEFDNTLYFNLPEIKKIKVLVVGENSFSLSKIFTTDEFEFTQENVTAVNYNQFQSYDFIIANEIDNIPTNLRESLIQFSNSGGNLGIIPSSNIDIQSYNQLFNQLNIGGINSRTSTDLKINTIHFQHPLFSGVFENEVDNFQYPNSSIQYQTNLKNASTALSFENGLAFASEILTNSSKVYWLSSPLNKEASNFENSPLIVPLIYNMATSSYKPSRLYYTVGLENSIAVNIQLMKDEILTLKGTEQEFIPQQIVTSNKVEISTNERPTKDGFYQILHQDTNISSIAFNYNRSENNFTNIDLSELVENNPNITLSDSIKESAQELQEQQEINQLFKWFLALAILFLFLEICVLKFFKI